MLVAKIGGPSAEWLRECVSEEGCGQPPGREVGISSRGMRYPSHGWKCTGGS
jgi:hypothetical protein